jgi:hypothetical protein
MRADRIRRSLDIIRAQTGVSLTFGGEVTRSRSLALRHFSGPTVGALPGVELAYDAGLGGRTVAQRRPLVLGDYVESDTISHQYDTVIRAERLRAIASAPVVIDRETSLVLYVAYRNDNHIADRILSALMDEARALEHDLLTSSQPGGALDAAETLRGRVRRAHAELCELSTVIDDRTLRSTLRAIADSLSLNPPNRSGRSVLSDFGLGPGFRAGDTAGPHYPECSTDQSSYRAGLGWSVRPPLSLAEHSLP